MRGGLFRQGVRSGASWEEMGSPRRGRVTPRRAGGRTLPTAKEGSATFGSGASNSTRDRIGCSWLNGSTRI